MALGKVDKEKIKDEKDKQTLASWHPFIEIAILRTWFKFKNEPNFILTEGDLKCWLFYFLQIKKPYVPFSVHSEVTHHYEVSTNNLKNSKYSFRDLSILCPWELEANDEFHKCLENGEEFHNKGFCHRATAFHIELKLVRTKYPLSRLKEDIDKLNNYQKGSNSLRKFIVVCGSRKVDEGVDEMFVSLKEYLNDFNEAIKEHVEFYLFDKEKISKCYWVKHAFVIVPLKP